ncbi:Regulation of nuclear pre-mRNA domain-containing protein 2 [Operophtera brumata]|uniref:Regulation of nuclear pre-mRNA domain-containing protein 2 n=1 Tax=Operophtera brumata TaxID=104452 RepID=A0A0L7L082_OPEBR|nr:Regulation of nuclear pre-mRNA domain-containing protein 2 [Operophtera brumata]
MGDTEDFNPLTFEKRLINLKDTQECIQGLSSWCLKQRTHHKKIVASWLNVLKRVKIEQRLVLFYLANDVIQYSKRKNYEFVESWGLNLQKATPLVRLVTTKLEIILQKNKSHKEETGKELNDGISRVERYTQALQREIVAREALLALLTSANQYYSTQRGEVKVVAYREIVAREALLALLTSANQYYSTQRGEVKVVAYAYKNFGSRVRALKRKLDELILTLPNADVPSPPARDEDVPSPGPDEDLELPPPTDNDAEDDISYNIDRTFNTSLAADGSLYNLGLSSFLTADNPMAMFNDTDLDTSSAILKVPIIGIKLVE